MARVLLVLGNGFDMMCGLRSSFQEYLDSDYYSPYIDIMKEMDKELRKTILKNTAEEFSIDFCKDFDFEKTITFWDIYFGLPHVYKIKDVQRWYNFEEKLRRFLHCIEMKSGEVDVMISTSGKRINKQMADDSSYKMNYFFYKYLSQISERMDSEVLYSHLFEELKLYEKRFGEYIRMEQIALDMYDDRARHIMEELIDSSKQDEIVCINTFNYSNLTHLSKSVWHINGDVENPIFGIDLPKVAPDNPGYIFTKTYRRLELSGKRSYLPSNSKFSKVIVCGHSLNRQDYSYFYSLLNYLGLDNGRSGSRNGYSIEFVYYRYGNKSSKEVRKETVSRVLDMLYEYKEEILNEKNFRIVDILHSTGAIKFKEITNPTRNEK